MTTKSIPPEEMAAYRATARKRAARRKAELDARYARAWQVARAAAQMLKEDFAANRVVLFGSLLNRRRFYERSDIDLAAWGIAEGACLRAVGALLDLDPEFSFDLVRMEEAYEEDAHATLVQTIEHEGTDL